ncbi:MAG: hypothetical protein GY855_00960 [candidate division Zixibacteria bacterium]|nr:hypothetical protein [candidate division Zixibacteria bacterium]
MKLKQLMGLTILVMFLAGIALTSTGCNIFGWTAKDDNATGYIAEGKKFMRDGDYANAEAEFQKAIDADPANADAYYYHAKATVLAAGINIGTLIDDLNTSNEGESLPLYTRDSSMTKAEDAANKNRLYQANLTAYNDLLKIMDNEATGNFNSKDIAVDFLVAMSVTGIVGMRDTDRDGDVDTTDIYLEIIAIDDGVYFIAGIDSFFNYNPGEATMAPYPNTGAIYFNALLAWVDDLFTFHLDEVIDILEDSNPEIDFDEVRYLIDDFLEVMRKYYVNTGIDGNRGEINNDGDGDTDEEHWGDRDNGDRDNDFYYWEDSTCDY